MKGKPKLIVALDVDNLDKAKHLVDILKDKVKIFKVGSQLFTACGPAAVKMVGEKGARVFLDLKFHDIPHTVFTSVSLATGLNCIINTTQLAVFMMTVHTEGGILMLKAAVRAATEKADELRIKRPFIIGVTRLTSDKNEKNIKKIVLEAARLAKEAGLDGVVCSVREAAMVRKEFGAEFLIVTPGIRPKGYKSDDQSRVATVKEAVQAKVDYIVVGRPIIDSENPRKAAEEILADIK